MAALINMGLSEEEAKTFKCYRGKGCPVCNKTGYKGRIALYEIMIVNDEIRKFVLEGASADELKKAAIRNDMKTLRMSGMTKVKEAVTTIEEVLRVTAGD